MRNNKYDKNNVQFLIRGYQALAELFDAFIKNIKRNNPVVKKKNNFVILMFA